MTAPVIGYGTRILQTWCLLGPAPAWCAGAEPYTNAPALCHMQGTEQNSGAPSTRVQPLRGSRAGSRARSTARGTTLLEGPECVLCCYRSSPSLLSCPGERTLGHSRQKMLKRMEPAQAHVLIPEIVPTSLSPQNRHRARAPGHYPRRQRLWGPPRPLAGAGHPCWFNSSQVFWPDTHRSQVLNAPPQGNTARLA